MRAWASPVYGLKCQAGAHSSPHQGQSQMPWEAGGRPPPTRSLAPAGGPLTFCSTSRKLSRSVALQVVLVVAVGEHGAGRGPGVDIIL